MVLIIRRLMCLCTILLLPTYAAGACSSASCGSSCSFHGLTCCAPIPRPFGHDDASATYLLFPQILQLVDTNLQNFADHNGPELCSAVEEAQAAGISIKANAQGMDLSGLSERSQETLFNAYVPDVGDEARDTGDFELESVEDQRMVFEEDKSMMRRSAERLRPPKSGSSSFEAARIHADLHRYGFHKIDSYPGLDVDRLKEEAVAALRNRGVWENDEGVKAVGDELDHLRPVLENVEILQAASDYFGGEPAELTGYEIVHLGPRLTPEQYQSGLWHHDRCGRRLKLFIYTDSVGDHDHPTLIARGTHNYTWFGMQNHAPTRFKNDWVTSTYGEQHLIKMTGPKGGGFFFDTNTIHRGDIDGVHTARNVIIVEYHTKKRIENDGWRNRDCLGANNHNVHRDIDLPSPSPSPPHPPQPSASSPPPPSPRPPPPPPFLSPFPSASPSPASVPSPDPSKSQLSAPSPARASQPSEVTGNQMTTADSDVAIAPMIIGVGVFFLFAGILALLATRILGRAPTRSSAAPMHRGRKPKGSRRLPDDDPSRQANGKSTGAHPNAATPDEAFGDDELDGIDEESGPRHRNAADAEAGDGSEVDMLRAENERLRAELQKARMQSRRGEEVPQRTFDMSD